MLVSVLGEAAANVESVVADITDAEAVGEAAFGL